MNEPSSSAQRLDYDALAADYGRRRRVHPGVVRRLVDSGRIGEHRRVLEVGCGSGNYFLLLRELTCCAARGLDPSVEMLSRARARPGAEALTWRKGMAEILPFPNAFFDVILSIDVIHHVEDRPAHFQAARRLLAPGGRL